MNSNAGRRLPQLTISRRKLLVDLALVVAAGGGLSVRRAHAQSTGGVFVGKVDGTNAFVGLVTDGEQVLGYVCDGTNFKERFDGTMAEAGDGQLTLVGEDGDLVTIVADGNTLPDLLASGGNLGGALITIDGTSSTFSAEPATGPGGVYLAGLALDDGTTMEGGSVALDDGTLQIDGGTVVLNTGELRGIAALILIVAGIIVPATLLLIPVFEHAEPTANVNSAPLMFTASVPVPGGSPGSTPQPIPQPVTQALATMQRGQSLSGPNGPQPVPMPMTVGRTTVPMAMVPQTPATLTHAAPGRPPR